MRPLSINDLMRERFGYVPNVMRQRSRVGVSNSITQVLTQNSGRVAWWITNNGFDIGLLNEDQQDLTNKRGIQLVPGGTLASYWFEDFDLTAAPLFGLNLRATPNLTALFDICEVVLIGDRDFAPGDVER